MSGATVSHIAPVCPGCTATMITRPSAFHERRIYWRCPVGCDFMVGAHDNGTPLGTPANGPTRAARRMAHAAFDPLWKGDAKVMRRREAYRWLCEALGISRDDGHISHMNEARCALLIAAATKRKAGR